MRCAIALLLCSLLHGADPRPVSKPPAKGAPARPADAQIEAAIRAKFAKSKIAADRFTVRVQGGIATLEGRTDVVQHKGTATRLAKSGGAAAVDNRIQVSDAARRKAAASLETSRRRAQVQHGAQSPTTAPSRRR